MGDGDAGPTVPRDVIADPSTSNYVHDTIGSSDRTLKLYDGLRHQVFNEPERESVYTDVKTWLIRHTDDKV